MRVVCISDTHMQHETINLPHGDVLIHAGDFSSSGAESQIRDFGQWLSRQPHTHKIIIAGNHDRLMQKKPQEAQQWLVANCSSVSYLYDSETTVTVNNVRYKIYGSPWQPEFFNWAFNLPRGIKLAEVWSKIPDDVDILVTHGPPLSIMDIVDRNSQNVGCEDLYNRIKQLKKLKLHVFGHIHEGYGVEEIDGIKFVNASINTVNYRPTNAPIIIDL